MHTINPNIFLYRELVFKGDNVFPALTIITGTCIKGGETANEFLFVIWH